MLYRITLICPPDRVDVHYLNLCDMDLVFMHGDKSVTSSRLVANKFGKAHKDVLRAIKSLECSEDFRQRNFAPSSYTTVQNKDLIEYVITRDGFTFLVMGFTGKQAAKFKEDYINAFNAMEKALTASNKPASVFDVMQAQLDALKDHETRLKEVEAKISTKDESYYTISGFSRLHGISMPVNEARRLGKQAKKLSKELGYNVGREYDGKYGHINSYHTDILNQIFNQKLLS